jgi:hypothetical protein
MAVVSRTLGSRLEADRLSSCPRHLRGDRIAKGIANRLIGRKDLADWDLPGDVVHGRAGWSYEMVL